MPASFASPAITVILCFFIRKPTPLDSCCETLRDALHDLRDIELEIVGAEAELVQPVHQVPDFGRAQQRLGRNAAPVEADAAQPVALDHRGLQAQLRAADGADIAARSRRRPR